MNPFRPLKYGLVLVQPIAVGVAFTQTGWWTWLPIGISFFFFPLIELFLKPRPENLDSAAREVVSHDRIYDWILYLMVPIQWGMMIWFFFSISQPGLDILSLLGRVFSMGLLCGVLGINVAHELGHRPRRIEQNMAKLLLLTSQYMHFFIEHNRGHHRNVSTPEDPSSARLNEPVYFFWVRSVFKGYISAWRLESNRLKRMGLKPFSASNEMLRFFFFQLGLLLIIGYFFGEFVLNCYFVSATIGFLLLETVNYIEHYGLVRKKVNENRYESATPMHSWNSDHPIGRLVLFELSRHSDHHYRPAKPYPLLDHHDESPQMPTGYPGMMLLSQIPPLWFLVMNPRVRRIRSLSGS
ncbi:MAG: alkane 1-monooxygenase [Bacteroidota bacterium]|nr:alkane 1-monooxygenase [Bacteroidota bacterium]MDX5504972.1 alkane 1-monooxygenase [Bacteroidota bacterium]